MLVTKRRIEIDPVNGAQAHSIVVGSVGEEVAGTEVGKERWIGAEVACERLLVHRILRYTYK